MKYIKIFEQFSKNKEIEEMVGFVGYHCSPVYITEFDGTIKNTSNGLDVYGKSWYTTLLEKLGWTVALQSKPDFLGDDPKSQKWLDKIYSMFIRRNINWIFVARYEPKTMYGEYVYAVTIDESKVLAVVDDTNEIDSDIYIYNHKKVKPKLIALFEPPIQQKKHIESELIFDKNDEGLGLFKKSARYKFPWEVSQDKYRDDYYSGNQYDGGYPHRLNSKQEKIAYNLLGIKPYSTSEYELIIALKNYIMEN